MSKVVKALGVSLVVVLARLLPFNFIIGSSHAIFSLSSVFAPVVAAQCGFFWVYTFFISKKLLVAPSVMLFFHRVPLFCAARVFQKPDLWFAAFLPVLCLVLFVVHPVGAQAWPYALYWLIPVVFCFMRDVVWARALQASFVAHAVGSVVWLYSGSISAEIWMSLIPIVACERLLIAGGIIVFNEICQIFMKVLSLLYCRYKVLHGVIE